MAKIAICLKLLCVIWITGIAAVPPKCKWTLKGNNNPYRSLRKFMRIWKLYPVYISEKVNGANLTCFLY